MMHPLVRASGVAADPVSFSAALESQALRRELGLMDVSAVDPLPMTREIHADGTRLWDQGLTEVIADLKS